MTLEELVNSNKEEVNKLLAAFGVESAYFSFSTEDSAITLCEVNFNSTSTYKVKDLIHPFQSFFAKHDHEHLISLFRLTPLTLFGKPINPQPNAVKFSPFAESKSVLKTEIPKIKMNAKDFMRRHYKELEIIFRTNQVAQVFLTFPDADEASIYGEIKFLSHPASNIKLLNSALITFFNSHGMPYLMKLTSLEVFGKPILPNAAAIDFKHFAPFSHENPIKELRDDRKIIPSLSSSIADLKTNETKAIPLIKNLSKKTALWLEKQGFDENQSLTEPQQLSKTNSYTPLQRALELYAAEDFKKSTLILNCIRELLQYNEVKNTINDPITIQGFGDVSPFALLVYRGETELVSLLINDDGLNANSILHAEFVSDDIGPCTALQLAIYRYLTESSKDDSILIKNLIEKKKIDINAISLEDSLLSFSLRYPFDAKRFKNWITYLIENGAKPSAGNNLAFFRLIEQMIIHMDNGNDIKDQITCLKLFLNSEHIDLTIKCPIMFEDLPETKGLTLLMILLCLHIDRKNPIESFIQVIISVLYKTIESNALVLLENGTPITAIREGIHHKIKDYLYGNSTAISLDINEEKDDLIINQKNLLREFGPTAEKYLENMIINPLINKIESLSLPIATALPTLLSRKTNSFFSDHSSSSSSSQLRRSSGKKEQREMRKKD